MYDENNPNNENQVNSYSWNNDINSGASNPQPDQPSSSKSTSKKTQWRSVAISCVVCTVLCFGAGYVGGLLGKGPSQYKSNSGVVSTESPDATVDDNTQTPATTENNGAISLEQNESVGISQIMGSEGYTFAQVAEMTAKSVVEITTETVVTGSYFGQYVSSGAGSGVVITQDGYIITNHHVIEDASTITVKLKNDDTEYEAKLIGSDSQTDIAVIKIEATGLQAASLGNSEQLVVGESVIAVGNPLGSLGGTVTNGIISALDREIEIDGQVMTLLQTNAAINPGNSGGGLFNGNGLLIGIVNAKSSGTDIEGLGFAVPINTAKAVAEDLINYGYVKGRVSMGVTLVDITDAQTAMQYRVQYLGCYVLRVQDGGSGDEAGLKSGDCILSMAGTSVSTSADVSKILSQYTIGDSVPMVVYRNRQEVSITITLQEETP